MPAFKIALQALFLATFVWSFLAVVRCRDYDELPPEDDLPPPIGDAQLVAGQYDGHCLDDNFCNFNRGNCSTASPLCPNRVCKCARGYAWDGFGNCSRTVALGQRCNAATDRCGTEEAVCSQSVCKCYSGYRISPSGQSCIPAIKTLYRGDRCFDTMQCHGNLACIGSICTCFPGFKAGTNNYTCVERGIGDYCNNNDDCGRTPNTLCRGTKCVCQLGFKQVQYQVSATETKQACIPIIDDFVSEGALCNSQIPISPDVSSNLCEPPLVCTECEKGVSICISP